MKWGRNKSSPPSLIARVFPVSWFKQKGSCPETTKQQRGKLDFATPNSSSSVGWREAVFYHDDDDAYLTLSFRDGRAGEGRGQKGRINPLWFDSEDEFQLPKSSGLEERGFPRGVHRSINDVVLDIEKKMKEKGNRRSEGIKVNTESQVKPANVSRRSKSRIMKQTDCRIRVLEEMKKGRIKPKKKKEHATEFNSFAVVKSSFDPQQDFTDSMVEMIRYKGTRRPEELQQLLAAYLTLNSDRYRNLIIKAFQQVRLELSKAAY